METAEIIRNIYAGLENHAETHYERWVTETPKGEVSISVHYDRLLDTYKSDVETYTLKFPKRSLEELVERAKASAKAELVAQGVISHCIETADDWCGDHGETIYKGPAEVRLALDLSREKPKLEYTWNRPDLQPIMPDDD